jgi:glycosyltransferase involved in cell wall biosynthesis
LKNIVLKTRFQGGALHGLYNELIKNPPDNYKFVKSESSQKSPLLKITFQHDNNLYKRFLYHFGSLPYFLAQLRGPNIKYDNCDLIYAAQHLIKTEQSWVVDLEFANALAAYCSMDLFKNIISKKLKSNGCKAILPWSEWGKTTLVNSIDCDEFKDKIHVVRYTVPIKHTNRIKENKSTIRVLFLGSINQCGFMRESYKGLYENVEAFIELQKKYDGLELIIRSSVTTEIRERVKKFPNIKILDTPLSDAELEQLYASSDLFPHSGYEALNLSILEAMSYGLPVIATSLYNIPEAIKHMKNGLLIDLPNTDLFYTKNKTPNEYSNPPVKAMTKLRPFMIEKIKESMKLLIEDSSLRQKIGREAAMTIEKGEFSIKHRNDVLKEIFDSATS